MSRGAPPPLRFLVLVVGGWVAIRTAVWVGWPDEAVHDAGIKPPTLQASADRSQSVPGIIIAASPDIVDPSPVSGAPPARVERRARRLELPGAVALQAPPIVPAAPDLPAARMLQVQTDPAAPPSRYAPSARRWSGSAWLLVRRDGAVPALAPGGILGGSQAGGRLLYRLNGDTTRPLALAARLSAPLRGRGAEAALGLDWRPIAGLPVHLLAERRQGLDGGGRSVFAAAVYGGASVNLPSGVRLDAYAQAGAVGTRSRDLFADGAVRVGLPLGPVEIGGSAWGAAQPGATRLDAGPQASLPLRVGESNLRLAADWRFRLAGDAMPGSGPVLTLGADF